MDRSTATARRADLAQDVIHLADARDALEGDASLGADPKVNLVRVFLQEKRVLPHDETPDRVIDRRVIVVTLIDRELKQVFGETATAALWKIIGDHGKVDAVQPEFNVGMARRRAGLLRHPSKNILEAIRPADSLRITRKVRDSCGFCRTYRAAAHCGCVARDRAPGDRALRALADSSRRDFVCLDGVRRRGCDLFLAGGHAALAAAGGARLLLPATLRRNMLDGMVALASGQARFARRGF